jgi:hypothetical protein
VNVNDFSGWLQTKSNNLLLGNVTRMDEQIYVLTSSIEDSFPRGDLDDFQNDF